MSLQRVEMDGKRTVKTGHVEDGIVVSADRSRDILGGVWVRVGLVKQVML